MKKQHFSISINAPVSKVWDMMIGKESYKEWTAPFSAGSYYEGSWNKGEKIKFLGPDGGGMSSEIAENKLHEFISIRHLGFFKDSIEDTTSPEVLAWAPAYENYSFSEQGEVTTVAIDLDMSDEWAEMMEEAWPKALKKLKEMCER